MYGNNERRGNWRKTAKAELQVLNLNWKQVQHNLLRTDSDLRVMLMSYVSVSTSEIEIMMKYENLGMLN